MNMPLVEPSGTGSPPLRVLCVIASPSDLPRFDESGLGREIADALEPLTSRGSVLLERLPVSTEAALKKSLAEGAWHVLYLVVHGEERTEANYGTIALNASNGSARYLTAQYFAGLAGASQSLRLVILQAAGEASRGFQTTVNALAEQVPAVLAAPTLSSRAARTFSAKLCASLLAGLNSDAVMKEVSLDMEPEGVRAGSLRMVCRNANEPVLPLEKGHATAAAVASAPEEAPAPTPASALAAWQELLLRKRAAGQFDVFLCHHSADKPAVKRVAQLLKEKGILPWLDIWELPPGQPWQPLLERQIESIKAAAVFIGSTGLGPWQEQEIHAFLRAFVKRKVPVIPVMLIDAPAQPELPAFLEGMVWVDFRSTDPDPLAMLIWGITGNRPED